MSSQNSRMGQTTAGSASTAIQLNAGASIPCGRARIKALSANSAKVYLGTNVNVGAGTGFELNPGDDTGWIETDDITRFWAISTTTAQVVCWMVAS